MTRAQRAKIAKLRKSARAAEKRWLATERQIMRLYRKLTALESQAAVQGSRYRDRDAKLFYATPEGGAFD